MQHQILFKSLIWLSHYLLFHLYYEQFLQNLSIYQLFQNHFFNLQTSYFNFLTFSFSQKHSFLNFINFVSVFACFSLITFLSFSEIDSFKISIFRFTFVELSLLTCSFRVKLSFQQLFHKPLCQYNQTLVLQEY